MSELNLVANDKTQEIIKQYLQENASESLANKINNGVRITLDGVELINRKSLDGFIKYASDEARKLVDKNASSACVEDMTVFGWAIHYFEEDSVLGALYNVDGTPYKAVKAKCEPKVAVTTPPKPQPKPQLSLFDLLENSDSEKTAEIPSEIVAADSLENNDYCPREEENEDNQSLEEDFDDSELDNAIKGKVMLNDGECVDFADFDGDVEEVVAKEVMPSQTPPKAFKGSPVYQRYMSVQQDYPKAIVATKLGDFYEFFAAGAIAVASELDLTLTGRDFGFETRVPMCGIPYHCIEKYFEKILEKHDLVVIENEQNIKCYSKKTEDQQVLSQATKAPNMHEQTQETSRQKERPIVATTSALPRQNEQLNALFALFGDCLEVKQ